MYVVCIFSSFAFIYPVVLVNGEIWLSSYFAKSIVTCFSELSSTGAISGLWLNLVFFSYSVFFSCIILNLGCPFTSYLIHLSFYSSNILVYDAFLNSVIWSFSQETWTAFFSHHCTHPVILHLRFSSSYHRVYILYLQCFSYFFFLGWPLHHA